MGLKIRIAIMQFLQFFVWGAWMPCMASWWFGTRHWDGTDFGLVFATMGIASLFMPTIAGIIADRWINAEKLYGIFMICNAILLFCVPFAPSPAAVFWIMFVSMCFYMPTIGLSITISYASMEEAGMNIIKEYPPVRVWGTVGFIVAMWIISLFGLETSASMFYIAGVAAVILGLYGFSMPKCPPLGRSTGASWFSSLGLDAFKLFKSYKMALFFIFSMLLGGVLQLSNAYGDVFVHSFSAIDIYKNCIAVKFPAIILSVSQMAEVVFILCVPFFLRKFGIKKVMMMSMFAWVFRFGLFGFGNPGDGLWMILLSMIVYGMAFDFFNISGSLYTELNAPPSIRASAQGLFMFMTNGVGAVLGSSLSGWAISAFYTTGSGANQVLQWQGWHGIWILFATYALIVGVLFAIMFKHRHNPAEMTSVGHH
ncbi:MAG TPA: MFS transporter [Lentisphaeria bacterium]|nr:MAG: nucleoside permease [Lentisphaerae bacterium GWF2_38_69]HBM16087.1 MFS transporter [Lentisphaeria bacterium]